jgi:hypothetical protein
MASSRIVTRGGGEVFPGFERLCEGNARTLKLLEWSFEQIRSSLELLQARIPQTRPPAGGPDAERLSSAIHHHDEEHP